VHRDERRIGDYGECHICGGRIAEKRVNQELWVKGKLIVIEGVPAGVCQQCGEKVVGAEVGQTIAALVADSKRLQKARRMTVPVIRFARQVA